MSKLEKYYYQQLFVEFILFEDLTKEDKKNIENSLRFAFWKLNTSCDEFIASIKKIFTWS